MDGSASRHAVAILPGRVRRAVRPLEVCNERVNKKRVGYRSLRRLRHGQRDADAPPLEIDRRREESQADQQLFIGVVPPVHLVNTHH